MKRILAFLFCALSLNAATWYVAPSASGSGTLVSPGEFYYFADTSSGAGAVASIIVGTSSRTDF